MSESAHRFSPRVPREVDIPKPRSRSAARWCSGCSPGCLTRHSPVSPRMTSWLSPRTATESVSARGPTRSSRVFQGGDHGAELGLIVGHVVPELDLPRGDGPVRSGDLVAAVSLTGVAKRPAVEDDRVIGPGNGACRLQAQRSRAVGPDAEITCSRLARALCRSRTRSISCCWESASGSISSSLSVCRLLPSPRVTREPIRRAWRPRL